MKITTFLVLATTILLASCSTPKDITYFQGLEAGDISDINSAPMITVKPEDKISIVVNSRDPQLMDLFNLPYVSRQLGQATRNTSSSLQGVSGYTVDAAGEIDFPVLGKIAVGGLTRTEISNLIKDKLISNNLIKDPIVTVEFINLYVSVLGEVNSPGMYSIDKDRVSILDAISMAKDLTIYGNRSDITVQRDEEGVITTYKVDLCDGKSLYASPVYYLRQNDVVYVAPNRTRAFQSTLNGNTFRSTSFWLSIASLIVSICVLIK